MPPDRRFRKLLRARVAAETIDGPGLRIRRAIPDEGLPAVGPFILLDHFGPTALPAGTSFPPNPHPHAGLETVTYLLDGALEHHDSAGHTGAIGAGEAQWMRAGRGVIHDEGPGLAIRERGGAMHALQLWINLPRGRKHVAPQFRVHRRADIPERAVGNATVRVLAGKLDGARGPIETFADPFAAHVIFASAGAAEIFVPAGIELGLYIIDGSVRAGNDSALERHRFAQLTDGDVVAIAAERPSQALLVGGPRLDAPLVRQGPFVMNTRAELEDAFRDYRAGRMGSLPE